MAIAVDTGSVVGSSYNPGPQTTLNFNTTIAAGSNRILFLTACGFGAADQLSATCLVGASPTAMSLAVKNTYANGFQVFIFYKVNPDTGTNNVVINSATSARIDYQCVAYTGVDQASPIDSTNSAAATSQTGLTVSTTVVASNCWLIGSWRNDNSSTMTLNSGTFRRDDGSGATTQIDSNGTVGTGSQSLGFSTPLANWGGAIASFKPATTSSVKQLAALGVG